jgi:putative acetyltransferase
MMVHRLAQDSDCDAIYELYMEQSANPFLTYDFMDKQEFSGIFQQLLSTDSVFVTELNEDVIATYRLVPKTYRQAHTVYLGSFTIKKEHQGKGLGSEVLNHIKAFALEKNKTRIELTVDINNPAAIALYKKSGFLVEGQIRNSYRRSDTGEYYDEYLMSVIL